jgi:hypothetical protein
MNTELTMHKIEKYRTRISNNNIPLSKRSIYMHKLEKYNELLPNNIYNQNGGFSSTNTNTVQIGGNNGTDDIDLINAQIDYITKLDINDIAKIKNQITQSRADKSKQYDTVITNISEVNNYIKNKLLPDINNRKQTLNNLAQYTKTS